VKDGESSDPDEELTDKIPCRKIPTHLPPLAATDARHESLKASFCIEVHGRGHYQSHVKDENIQDDDVETPPVNSTTRLHFPDVNENNTNRHTTNASNPIKVVTESLLVDTHSRDHDTSADDLAPLPPRTTVKYNQHSSLHHSTSYQVIDANSKRASIFTHASYRIKEYIPYITGMHHEGLQEVSSLLSDTPISIYSRQFIQRELEDAFIRNQNISLRHNTISVSMLGIAGVCLTILNAINPNSTFVFNAFPTAFTAVGVLGTLIMIVWKAPIRFLERYQSIICAFAVTLAGSILMAGWDAVYYTTFSPNGPKGTFLTYITSSESLLISIN
jgi:hypothetical protein